jgi:fructokinase
LANEPALGTNDSNHDNGMKRKPLLIGVGELLWDMFPNGRQLGGAPANVAHHACQMGAEASVVSCLGDDDMGREILDLLQTRGITTNGITIHQTLPTGTVTVKLLPDGQPDYTIHKDVAWDCISCADTDPVTLERASALVFGTLAQRSERSRKSIRSLLASAPPETLRVFDINLRQDFHSPDIIEDGMIEADVLKLNDVEMGVLAPMLGLSGTDREKMHQLAMRFELAVVALTYGDRGSLLYADGQFSGHPGIATAVVDTVGAGDSFTACLIMGWLHRWDLDRINSCANRIAAFVCACPGATPELPDEMLEWFPENSVSRASQTRELDRPPSPV